MFARLEEFRFARWVKSLNRSTQILLSLTLVTALNYAAARHYERWDLTPDRHFSLSPETLAYLQQKVPRTPDTPLQIISILPAGNPDDTRVSDEQIKRLLDEYAEAGKKAGIPLEINPGNPNHQALNPLVESARFEDPPAGGCSGVYADSGAAGGPLPCLEQRGSLRHKDDGRRQADAHGLQRGERHHVGHSGCDPDRAGRNILHDRA